MWKGCCRVCVEGLLLDMLCTTIVSHTGLLVLLLKPLKQKTHTHLPLDVADHVDHHKKQRIGQQPCQQQIGRKCFEFLFFLLIILSNQLQVGEVLVAGHHGCPKRLAFIALAGTE